MYLKKAKKENIMATFITGKKVVLRTLTRDDLPALTEWINDPEITQYLNMYHPMMFESEEQWYEKLIDSTTNFVLAIETKDEKKNFIGTMGILQIDHRNQRAATGALLGDKKCHGRGYGTDAKMHLLHWAFRELNLRKVRSSVLATNHRSKRYLEKTGYRQIGVRKEDHLLRGRFVDEILMEVFRDDFMEIWEAYSRE
tara:strand:+ start:3445 stop:4038 length:594 start_codon:yes stop_codon:yes gene_type:complete